MRKGIKETVSKLLLEEPYTRENDNYLIMRVAQELEPNLAGSMFVNIRFSKLSFEGVTRARRNFFKKNPHLKPLKITMIREKEEQAYRIEYGNENHIPSLY